MSLNYPKNNNMETVNVTYIGVIRNKNGQVEFTKEAIPQKQTLISELKAMVENPNRTIFDLQSRMNQEFIPTERVAINYLSPFLYSVSYVSGVTYPKAPTIEEYKLDIEHKKAELTNRGGRVDERLESYLKDKKDDFFAKCADFCRAYSYSSLLKKLRLDKDIKMLTVGRIGWTDLQYQINDDIQFTVHTNFGFGGSSYCYINLTYKGIDILPYSFFVKYYYADQLDIRRYTRRYNVDENCWDYAFLFVEEIANKAINDEEHFVKMCVMNEVQEMISGLRNILAYPRQYFDTRIAHKNDQNESHYLGIRNMNSEDKRLYAVYPNEVIKVFQAEKIAGSLDFLEKLSELKPIYSQVQDVIDEIKGLGQKLLPQLESNIEEINKDIEELQANEDNLSEQISVLNKKIEAHTAKIDSLYERKKKKAGEDETIYRYSVENEYTASHPEYSSLIKERDDLSSKRSKIHEERCQRKCFHSTMSNYYKTIQKGGE